jgi:hypothetical protein
LNLRGERLTLVGDALWVAAYAAAIWVGWRDHTYAIPLPAICLNVTWELLFAFWRPPRGRAKRALYALWFLLDIVILGQALDYGPPGADAHGALGLWRVLTAGGLVAGLVLHLWLFLRFQRPYHVAFGLNLLMSALFVRLYFVRPDGLGLSLAVAWLKCGGTTLISAANVLRYRGELRREPLLTVFMLGILVLDLVYLVLLAGAPGRGPG